MRNLAKSELLAVVASGNSGSSSKSGGGSSGSSSSGSGGATSGPHGCPAKYHWESGSASESMGGNIGAGGVVKGNGSRTRTWGSCTPNGQHRNGNGQLVPDKKTA